MINNQSPTCRQNIIQGTCILLRKVGEKVLLKFLLEMLFNEKLKMYNLSKDEK